MGHLKRLKLHTARLAESSKDSRHQQWVCVLQLLPANDPRNTHTLSRLGSCPTCGVLWRLLKHSARIKDSARLASGVGKSRGRDLRFFYYFFWQKYFSSRAEILSPPSIIFQQGDCDWIGAFLFFFFFLFRNELSHLSGQVVQVIERFLITKPTRCLAALVESDSLTLGNRYIYICIYISVEAINYIATETGGVIVTQGQ